MWFFIFLRTVPEECSPYNSQEDPVAKGSAGCGVFFIYITYYELIRWEYWNLERVTNQQKLGPFSDTKQTLLYKMQKEKNIYNLLLDPHTNLWKSETSRDNLEIIFWLSLLVSNFQIFKDQCGSVPSIPVAVLDLT